MPTPEVQSSTPNLMPEPQNSVEALEVVDVNQNQTEEAISASLPPSTNVTPIVCRQQTPHSHGASPSPRQSYHPLETEGL